MKRITPLTIFFIVTISCVVWAEKYAPDEVIVSFHNKTWTALRT